MPDVKHFDREAVLEQVERLFWQRGVVSTGVAEVVARTGLSRSSLYATFGGKDELYVEALRRYVEQRSRPAFDRLATDERGLPAIEGFFDRLIQARCTGEHARWGCMISNAHAGADSSGPEIRRLLDSYQAQLRTAMRAALDVAGEKGQLRADLGLEASAEMLALLAYGVNLRSRVGAEASVLRAAVAAALAPLQP